MRVALIGGAGEVGAEIARDLAQVDEIDSLLIADLDARRAAQLADELASERPQVSASGIDVRDSQSALSVLAGVDVLMNCTSFALFEPVLDLARAAGVDYADLISEPEDRHRRAAERAGITAISGLGASPGLSNVLVRHFADTVDELHEVEISWISLRTVAPTPGLLDTIIWELSEDCVTRAYYRNGRHHRAAFLEGSRLVEFASPVGPQYVYYVPHTEVATLPRHFTGYWPVPRSRTPSRRSGGAAGAGATRHRGCCTSTSSSAVLATASRSGGPTRSATPPTGASAAWPG
jgi:saccharopine dehydrogenase (NAD+, L-lysine-forming)